MSNLQPTSSGTLPRIHLNLLDSDDGSDHNNIQESQKKHQLYQALQSYLQETNQLESILKSHINSNEETSKRLESSPEFGKRQANIDVQELIREIEKRKDGLSYIQDMLSKKEEANQFGDNQKSNDNFQEQDRIKIANEHQEIHYEQRATPGLKLKGIIKKFQVKHLQDLLPIKKPLPFVMKACQLFSLLHFSLKKDFNPQNSMCAFTEWTEIIKYMIASPRVYQDIQLHIKLKIENLEYNYDFISLLLKEYQCHEKLFTYNRLQTSEATNIILQLFITSLEYITYIEELRVHGKYNDFIRNLRKKKVVPPAPQIIQPLSIQQHMQQVQAQIQHQQRNQNTYQSYHQKVVSRPQTANSQTRTMPRATITPKREIIANPEKRPSTVRMNKDLIIQSFQTQKQQQQPLVSEQPQRISFGTQSRSTSVLNSSKNIKSAGVKIQSERSSSNKKERKSTTPVSCFLNGGGTRFDYKPVVHSSRSPIHQKVKEIVPSPITRIIQAHQQKGIFTSVRSKTPIKQQIINQRNIEDQEDQQSIQQIKQVVDYTKIGQKIQIIDDQFSLRGSPNKIAAANKGSAHQKHLSHLNIEFSFCSDGGNSPSKKTNPDGSAILRPTFEIADNKSLNTINIFTNHIDLKEDQQYISAGKESQISQSPSRKTQDQNSLQENGDFFMEGDLDSQVPIFKLNIPPISPKNDQHLTDFDSQNRILKFKSPTSDSQRRNAQCSLSSQNRYKIPSKCESEENPNKDGCLASLNPLSATMDSDDDSSIGQPSTVQKQVEHGIKTLADDSSDTLHYKAKDQDMSTQFTDSQNKVYIGDFTYKEKHAVESMIQQLEKELFKSKYYKAKQQNNHQQSREEGEITAASQNYDSRPQD